MDVADTPADIGADAVLVALRDAIDDADAESLAPEAEEVDASVDTAAVAAAEVEVDELDDVWVCVNDSPMMVRVYTSAGDCANVKISDPELALQSQPS